MDEAVIGLVNRQEHLANVIMDRLDAFLSPEELERNWVIAELGAQLLYSNPLYVSSARHAVFFGVLKEMIVGYEVNTNQEHAEYYVVINGGEFTLKFTYHEALIVILRTLIDFRIHTRLQSVNDIPHPIMVAFLKRDGTRAYLMNKIFASVEDTLDVMQLYKDAVIGQATMDKLLQMGARAIAEENYETPVNEPQYYSGADPLAHPEAFPLDPHTNILLPLRKPMSGPPPLGFGSLEQLHLLCTVFTYLRPALNDILISTVGCRGKALCTVDTLISMLHVTLTQSIDNQGSNTLTMRTLYGDPLLEPLFNKLDAISTEVAQLLSGQCQSLMLRMQYEEHRPFVVRFHAELQSVFPELALTAPGLEKQPTQRRWAPVLCTQMPLSLLLMKMAGQGIVFSAMLKLKSFLQGKKRTYYMAYEMPPKATLVSLQLSLVGIRNRYAKHFPLVFEPHFCTLSVQHRIYLIAIPEQVECFKLLMLLEALPDRPTLQCYDFYCNVWLKAIAVARPASMLRRVSLYCLVSALALMIGGKRCQRQIAHPEEDPDGFQLYELLPQLLQLFPQADSAEHRQVLLGFLCLHNNTRKLSKAGLNALTERTTDPFPEDPLLQAALAKLSAQSNRRAQSDAGVTLQGRCKTPLWYSLYDCILSNRTTLTEDEKSTVLIALGTKTSRRLYQNPPESRFSSTPLEPPALNYADLVIKNNMQLKQQILKHSLFDVCLDDEQLRHDSRKQFARTEFAFPRVFQKTSEPYSDMATYVLRLEQLAYCPTERHGSIDGISVLDPRHWQKNNDYGFMLPLDDMLQINFEECFFLCDNPAKWTQGVEPGSDSLVSSPMHTVVQCNQLLELALQYNIDWQPGTLTAGTEYAGRYSELIRAIHNRIE